MTLDELLVHAQDLIAGGVPGTTHCVLNVGKVKGVALRPGVLSPMTHDTRRGYWDNHADSTAEVVLRFGE